MVFYKYNMKFEDYLNEAIKYKYVVRQGKRIKKAISTRQGKYRVEKDPVTGKLKEVRITASEKRHRKIGQMKGKIKRQSKMNLIKKRQKKSFTARKNMGIAYNKKLPDINMNRKPYKPVPNPWQNKDKDKLLAPSFKESFQGYLDEQLNEQLLLEWPENVIWSDSTKGIEIGWDWCSEETPEDGEWLAQLVLLFRYGALKTLRPDRNNIGNDNGFITQPYLYFDKPQLEDIADNLMLDWAFLSVAHNDLKLIKDEKLLKDLETYVPSRLWKKIVEYSPSK